jgi:hypothetical protein
MEWRGHPSRARRGRQGGGLAFDGLYFLERACQVQVLALSTGKPLRKVGASVAAQTGAEFGHNKGAPYGEAHFAALKRILKREGADFAD